MVQFEIPSQTCRTACQIETGLLKRSASCSSYMYIPVSIHPMTQPHTHTHTHKGKPTPLRSTLFTWPISAFSDLGAFPCTFSTERAGAGEVQSTERAEKSSQSLHGQNVDIDMKFAKKKKTCIIFHMCHIYVCVGGGDIYLYICVCVCEVK
jgi:hypothetical protein